MASWSANNDVSSAPKFVDGMIGYANISSSYANASSTQSLWAPDAAQASGKAYHTGWVHVKKGSGPVASLVIVTGGTGYANTDTWALGSANGTLSTNSTGGITGTTITNAGSGLQTAGANVTITTSAGTGGQVTATLGGRGGRKQYETLVALTNVTTANSANDYVTMP